MAIEGLHASITGQTLVFQATPKIRAATSAEIAAYTGTAGEMYWNTTTNRLAVMDGSTAGGHDIVPNKHRGCLLTKSSDQAITTNNNSQFVSWDTETYDTDGFHEGVTNPTRITIPANVAKVRFYAQVDWAVNSTGVRITALEKNGLGTVPGCAVSGQISAGTSGSSVQNIVSPPLVVDEGDYFEIRVYQTSGGNLNVDGVATTYFSVEVVETE